MAIRHARRWSRRFGDDDDWEALEALAAALDDGNEANRASLRAVVRAWKADIYHEKLPYLIDEARSTYRSASKEFTARGVNKLEDFDWYELEEVDLLRRSSRSESSRRADDLRRVYRDCGALAAGRCHGTRRRP